MNKNININKEDRKLVTKTIICTILTILLGYVLLGIPYIKIIPEAIILLLVTGTLLEFYGTLFTDSAKRKLQKSTEKKGK